MKNNFLLLFAATILSVSARGQLETFLGDMNPERNYYDIRNSMVVYLDSLKNTMDSATFYAGGGEYKRFKKFEEMWEPRVSPHGFFSPFIDAEYDFFTNLKDSYNYYINEPWQELGPQRSLERNGFKGIGPVEFVTFYDNGTDDSTHFMMTGSTSGGLFYSTDTAQTWHNAGSDAWPASGCVSAIFHPNRHNSWFAASSGGSSTTSSWIRKTGGIWRTTNSGQEWEQIADFTDFNNDPSIKIYKIVIKPQLPQKLYAVTSKGLFKTDTCLAENPGWEKVLEGKVYDLECKPNSSSVLYASLFDDNDTVWKLVYSEQYGNSGTWNEMEQLPVTLTNGGESLNNITIEVSKAKPGYLYAAIRNYDEAYVKEYFYKNLESTDSWISIYSDSRYNHGTGHAFGVEQVQHGEEIMFSRSIWLAKCDFYDNVDTIKNIIHPDVEDVVYHPYHVGEVWICTHGGVEVSYDNGDNWDHRYNGLGVAQVEKMATSFTNPEFILTGLYHDGTKLTVAEYEPGWDPDWKYCKWLDGQKPLIDNKIPFNMWASGQQGSWIYTTDTFNTSQKISTTTHFISEGALNKEDPKVLFRNAESNETPFQEDILRSPNRGLSNDTISSFTDFFEQDRSILITGVFTPYSNGDYLAVILIEREYLDDNWIDKYHLFFTKNANADPGEVTWHKITTPRDENTRISCIGFDPYNPDTIYLSYGSPIVISDGITSLIYKLDCSDVTVVQSEDITFNLPETSVSYRSIETNKQSIGGVFLATEFGIFYTDNNQMLNTGNEWLMVGTNLPHVRARGIEINYPSNTLRVGLYGRGVWELPLPEACQKNPEAINITVDTLWNSFTLLEQDLIVNEGATLQLGPDAIIAALPSTKIIVHPGGKLVINGGTLTNACGDLWGGIEVHGDPEATQIPVNQGWLSISNGGTIENAVVAVRMGNSNVAPPDGGGVPAVDSKGGGIFHADEAVFRNNRSGVIYHEYHGRNIGNITLTTFKITDVLADGSLPLDHIYMSGVEGIRINGCTFANTRESSVQATERGNGIKSFNATFYVGRQCISGTTPCAEYKQTTFQGLQYGIFATASTTNDFADIRHVECMGNYRAVYLSGMTLPRVTSCDFYFSNMQSVEGYGIYLDACTDYWIEDNYFQGNPLFSTGIGIVVNESGYDPNEIYRNEFQNIGYGVMAQGLNRNPLTGEGLVCRCNTFESTAFDIAVTYDDSQELVHEGIANHQGASGPAPEDKAGNLFYIPGPPNDDYDDINNEGNDIIYYHPSNYALGYDNVVPEDYTDNVTLDEENVFPAWDFEVHCPPSEEPGGGTDSEELRGLLATTKQQVDSAEIVLAQLIDGGNTDEMQYEVESSLPPETYQVYSELMNKSPYLSDTVVSTAIEKEDVLPGSMVRDIMVANPNTAKTKQLIDKLDERWVPLPDYMKAQILQGKNIVSIREEAESELAALKLKKAGAMSRLQRYYMNDTLNPVASRDSLMLLLAGENSLMSKYQLASLHMIYGDALQGQAVLNEIPQSFNLTPMQSSNHESWQEYLNLVSERIENGNSVCGTDSLQISVLLALHADAQGLPKVYARNTLMTLGEIIYDEPIYLPDMLKSAEATAEYEALMSKLDEAPQNLIIMPNPAKDYVIVSYETEQARDAVVEICDMKGTMQYSHRIVNNVDQLTIPTVNWQPGTYITVLKRNGNIVESVKFSIVN